MSDASSKQDGPNSPFAQPAVTKHGGRVELRLLPGDPQRPGARYVARFFFDEKVIEGWATIEAPPLGQPHPLIQIEADALPSWLADFTVTLLRTTARTVFAEADQAAQLWPRRLTRWRKEPNK